MVETKRGELQELGPIFRGPLARRAHDEVAAALAAWLGSHSERDALVAGARHHVSMAVTARVAGNRRMLADLS